MTYQIILLSAIVVLSLLMLIEAIDEFFSKRIPRAIYNILLIVFFVPTVITFPYSPNDEMMIGFNPGIWIWTAFVMWPSILSLLARWMSNLLLKRTRELRGIYYLWIRIGTIAVLLFANIVWAVSVTAVRQ